MKVVARTLVVLIISAVVLGGWALTRSRTSSSSATGSANQSNDGHARMLALLAEIRDKDLESNPLYSFKNLRKQEADLEALPRKANADERMDLQIHVGTLELILGENQAAHKNLLAAYRTIQRIPGLVKRNEELSTLQSIAVASLRRGEAENCIGNCTCDSCIIPIQGGGIHVKPEGSIGAMKHLNELLELDPNNLTARWLLNVAAMTLGQYPEKIPDKYLIPPSAFSSPIEFPRFMNIAHGLGIDVLSLAGGVVVEDFDDDGRLDLVMSNWGPAGQLRYFKNTGGGLFEEQTKQAGFEGLLGGLNMMQADYDNDGDADILILRGAWRGENGRHPNSLLENDGKGHFRDVTFDVGLGEVHYPTQAAGWADFDNDGDLDLYIGNEEFPSQLFENNGKKHFQDIAEKAGVLNNSYTKGVSWGDYNGDGFPDIYVSNYGKPGRLSDGNSTNNYFAAAVGTPNRLYRNNKDGTFTDVAEELGVIRPLLGFPTWFWDVNNDGVLDIFVASYAGTTSDVAAEYLGLPQSAEPDCLYLGDGKGGFQEVGKEFGLRRVTLAMGANFGDLDNDGFDDFYLGTGAPEYESLVPNIMYKNQAGRSFADVTAAGGFGHLQKGHAVAFADFDNDGDQDVFHVIGGAYGGDVFPNALFENPGFKNHFICVKLVGTKSNRSAIGAHVQVTIEEDGKPRAIHKWVNSGGSFGANPLRREIGIGHATRILKMEVTWPTTKETQEFTDVALDAFVEVTEGKADLRVLPKAK